MTGNGAAENCATFKRLGTQIAREALPIALIIDNNLLELLDLKIAFPHPSRSNTTIYIMGDMPHLVKKVVNCLEMSGNQKSQRHLEYDNEHICLSRLHEIWEKARKDTNNNGKPSLLGFRKLSYDHYIKNPNNRMKVHLATQVCSQTQIKVVENWGDGDRDLKVIPLLTNMDRFIDIMNGSGNKNCHHINSPDHHHLDELLEILDFFRLWKNQKEEKPLSFITSQSYEDFQWTILGLVGICKQYLSPEKYRVIDQRRAGSDCIENHFANCNHSCPNGSLSEFRSASAKATGVNANTFTGRNFAKNNSSGDKLIHGSELFALLTKVNTHRSSKQSFKLNK